MKKNMNIIIIPCADIQIFKAWEHSRSATKSKSLFYIPLPTIFHLVVVYDNDWWLPDPQTTFQNQSGSLISAQWGKSGGQGWLGY